MKTWNCWLLARLRGFFGSCPSNWRIGVADLHLLSRPCFSFGINVVKGDWSSTQVPKPEITSAPCRLKASPPFHESFHHASHFCRAEVLHVPSGSMGRAAGARNCRVTLGFDSECVVTAGLCTAVGSNLAFISILR